MYAGRMYLHDSDCTTIRLTAHHAVHVVANVCSATGSSKAAVMPHVRHVRKKASMCGSAVQPRTNHASKRKELTCDPCHVR